MSSEILLPRIWEKNQKAEEKVGETAWEFQPKCARVMFLSFFADFSRNFVENLDYLHAHTSYFLSQFFSEVLTCVKC